MQECLTKRLAIMPKRFKTDHDAITALIVSFDDFKEQDKQDKQLIRNDIKQLGDGVVGRITAAEQSLSKFESDKTDLQKTAIEADKRLTRIETTVYGPNHDGKGGGTEMIVSLGNQISDSKESFETTRKWVYTLISGAILITFTIMGYFVYQLNMINAEHKIIGENIIKIQTDITNLQK